jgi:hypothetical protein
MEFSLLFVQSLALPFAHKQPNRLTSCLKRKEKPQSLYSRVYI